MLSRPWAYGSVPEIDKGGHVAMRYRLEAIQDAGALVVLVRRTELKLDWVRQPNVSAGSRHRALAVKRPDAKDMMVVSVTTYASSVEHVVVASMSSTKKRELAV